MKIMFYAHCYFDEPTGYGIQKKINSQIAALRKLGHTVHYIGYMPFEDIKGFCVDDGKNRKLLYPIEYYGTFQFWSAQIYLAKLIRDKDDYDIIYMRPPRLSPHTLRLFSAVKKIGAKPILEIPAFPYRRDYFNRTFYFKILLLIDQISGMFAKFYLSRIVSFTRRKKIFGVPVITIGNGIDVNSLPFTKAVGYDNHTINIIAPSSMNISQGYDRFIRGLANYTKKPNHPNIKVKMVGDGPELKNLKNLVDKLNVQSYVEFTGALTGDAFLEEMKKADMGLGALGKHRLGQSHTSILKVPEFCAMGLPFLIGYDDINLSDDFRWAMRITASDEPVDIAKVVEFFLKTIKVCDFKERMRDFAIENMTWEKQMKKVIEYVGES